MLTATLGDEQAVDAVVILDAESTPLAPLRSGGGQGGAGDRLRQPPRGRSAAVHGGSRVSARTPRSP
ncbi:hypothetical protein QJS66_20945 [Kocuria rhizophila]|nr:hypothetical protein QJS66_20945 [Kocuria rhizophila]